MFIFTIKKNSRKILFHIFTKYIEASSLLFPLSQKFAAMSFIDVMTGFFSSSF